MDLRDTCDMPYRRGYFHRMKRIDRALRMLRLLDKSSAWYPAEALSSVIALPVLEEILFPGVGFARVKRNARHLPRQVKRARIGALMQNIVRFQRSLTPEQQVALDDFMMKLK